MSDGHHHHHHHSENPSNKKALIAAAALNTVFAVVQVIVGIKTGSIVVLADAAHQVVDALGLLTAMAAVILMAKPSTSTMSFGWGKADALGGFVSGLLLIGSVCWIAYESVDRLLNPSSVDSGGVIIIGLAGLAVNGLSVLILGSGQAILSIKAARLHLLTDLAGSALVLITGLLLTKSSATWLDPAASLVLCLAVARSTIQLLSAATYELLDRAPPAVSPSDIVSTLSQQPGVKEVHHVHVRPLGQSRTSVTAHVVVDGTQSLHQAQERTLSLTSALKKELPIAHSTLQLECHPCANDAC